ncbi:MAG: LCP family protein [Patescibacteria group bacterium]
MIDFKKNIENLEKEVEEKVKKKKPKSKFKLILKFASYFIVFLFIGLLIFSSRANISDQQSNSWIYKLPIIGQIKHLAESANKELKGEDRDRINILLLGMGGKNHEGGYLTDTIMLASIEPSTKKISLLSIPRDLSIPMENMGWRKVNNINAFAEVANPDSGGLAVSPALGDILEIPIDYYFRVDFAGFVNIIDELGGVEIEVENKLEDFRYPIMGMEDAYPYEARYEHLYIETGKQKMDGELALKYVRSRHALGVEGSDFARARRQQKVLEATKDKLLSKYILFKPMMISNIINQLQEHVSTNLKIWEILNLWNLIKDTKKENLINKVLDNSPSGLLKDTISEQGAYVLIPTSGDFAEIVYLVHNIFSDVPLESKTKVATEKATIEVRNGTWINGLANQKALDLEKYGFEVIRIGNSSHQNFQKSVIYDLTFGEKIESLSILKEKTGANVSFAIPQWLIDDITNDLADEVNPEQPDFLLILGQDADATGSGVENIEQ